MIKNNTKINFKKISKFLAMVTVPVRSGHGPGTVYTNEGSRFGRVKKGYRRKNAKTTVCLR